MTTKTQAERLVRKIIEMIGQPPSDTQAKLAQEYADLCRAASRRLEQCALMIEAGQSLQALQLAETPPPLLDLITILSFRQEPQWRAYCQSNQFPWAEPFYDKFVRQLNAAYGDGIGADHPYYRDYRRAMLKRDDQRALSILRVIARMNPADENTTAELKRMEEKLLRVKLEKLREAVAAGDTVAARGYLAQIEASGAPVPTSHPVWQQAQVARCQEILRRAQTLRESDAWQEAEALVDEIHAVATQYSIELPTADADIWTALEEWTSEKRGNYAAEQDFRRALSALEYEIQTIEGRRAKASRPDLVEATNQLNSFAAKSREVERFGRPLDESLTQRQQRVHAWLQQQLQAAKSRKRNIIAAVVAVVLVIIGASIPFILNWTGERDLTKRLADLESGRHVQEAGVLLSNIPVRLMSRPGMTEAAAGAKSFIAHEYEMLTTFNASIDALNAIAATGFRQDVAQVGPRRTQVEHALAPLAPEFQAAAKSALAAWDAKWQSFRNTTLAAELDRAETLAALLKGTNGYNAVHAALPRIQSILDQAAPLTINPPDLDGDLDTRLRELNAKVALWTANGERWLKAQAALADAGGLDEYLDRLEKMAQSPFASSAQRDGADEIDRIKINTETLLGELLLPNSRGSWDSLTNVSAWRTTLMAEQPTEKEKHDYLDLRDDKNILPVYVYQLVANSRPRNTYHTHLVFAQTALSLDRAGQMSGQVYDPANFPEAARFIPTTYSDWDYSSIVRSNRIQEGETFERTGLGDLIDPNTGSYQKPILQLLDQLDRDDNSSSLFRAYVTLKLFDLADPRKDQWGLQWCPDAARHLQALKELGVNDLRSGDWMAPVPVAKYEAPFQKYFERARLVPLEKQARLLQQLALETCQADFTYAGYIDSEGRAALHRSTAPEVEYWGWTANSETAALLLRKNANGLTRVAEPLPFTPLFVFNGNRRQLLRDKIRDTAYPPAKVAEILPPFFSGL